jgi:hypothetical protein
MGAPTITGTVYELVAGSRQPIAGTRLWFGAVELGVATTVSDRDGHYLACNVPSDTELVARKPGFVDTDLYPIDTSRSVIDVEMRR